MSVELDHLELVLKEVPRDIVLPASVRAKFDEPTRTWRILPMHYFELKEWLSRTGVKLSTKINENFEMSSELVQSLKPTYELRPYQKRAVEELEKRRWRGVVVLPTGAGKTVIGLEVINKLRCRTLICVPTLDLMNQWVEKLVRMLSVPRKFIGLYGGERREIREITVATYASARTHDFLKRVVDYFGLVIFDEAHHLAGRVTREIARRLIAPYRVGLTATVDERAKEVLESLIGPVVRISTLRELTERGFLAPFEHRRIYVSLADDERREYEELMRKYVEYVKRIPEEDEITRFRELVRRSVKDREAREALLARIRAKRIALESKEKLRVLEELLKKHRNDKVVIFTRHVDTAKYISYLFGIPCITGETPRKRRREILEMFEAGLVTKLVAAEALDEGVDLPSASVAIILAGRPSKRQFIQRIGRVLRPLPGKRAVIYEIITKATYDAFAAKMRRVREEEL